jgi:daunosaminyl-N,N-dimethyltransferase/N-dimethyltransferase
MEHRSLYDSRARLYDLIYHWKDYAADARRVRNFLESEGIPDGSRVVEAACGTGSHLLHLSEWYEVSGYDLGEGMLEVAREKLPDVPLSRADMRDHVVTPPADALLCLFSSIGYAFPDETLIATLGCFAASVRPGGVVLVEPWLRPADYRDGSAHLHTYDDEEIKVARASVAQAEGRLTILEEHWVVARANVGTESFVDHDELWMYTDEEMAAAFEAAGLDACRMQGTRTPDRGLYLARKPA